MRSVAAGRKRFAFARDQAHGASCSAPAALISLAFEFEALGAAALEEADRGAQAAVGRELVRDALRVVMPRILENGARFGQLDERELGRRSAARLRDVDQPAVALDDAQVLERAHLPLRVDR